jgi:hypothetical protein
MIAKLRELFSFSLTETQKKNKNSNNIELSNCPLREMMCKVHHTAINKSFENSEKYRKEKDFINSIEYLESAFSRTSELMEHPCTNCAQHYRSVIYDSIIVMHEELDKKSKGFFGKKRYKRMFQKADSVLKEFEGKGIHNSNHININNKSFLGNYLN